MNKTIVLQKRPFGPLKADNFKILDDRTPKLEAGKLLLRSMFFSVDPYMRNRMNAIRSYVDPFKVGEPIEGDAIAEVMDSDHPDFRPGDRVTGSFPWKEMMCIDPARATKINDTGISPTAYLGILGLTGLTAYFGLTDVGKIRPGEQVVISGAAGAVGSVAGQIARIMGCQVTGIAGSEQKIQYITDELKFDRAINYKSFPNIRKALAKTNPDGIDIYFDNVGGDVSDSVMYFLNPHARIVLCGQIALYNQSRISTGPRLNAQLIVKRARMEGFIVHDYKDRYPEAIEDLKKWIMQNELSYRETIIEGFSNLPSALMGLFKGENIGKMIVGVA
jgi:NADPH-dependent curcumin reductase CurA